MIKIGRNDKCPCGSGAKYKKCCLKKYKFLEFNIEERTMSVEVNKFRENYNKLISDNKILSNEAFKKYYSVLFSEIQSIKNYIENHKDFSAFEYASLFFYIGTYYSNLANTHDTKRILDIIENKSKYQKIETDIIFIPHEDENRIDKTIMHFHNKSNENLLIAKNLLSNSFDSDYQNIDYFKLLYFHTNIHIFNNLNDICPLLAVFLIEDFEKTHNHELDIYNKIKLSLSYIEAVKQCKKYKNNGYKLVKIQLNANSFFRKNNIMSQLSMLYNTFPVKSEAIVKDLLSDINFIMDVKISFSDFINENPADLFKVSNIISNTSCSLKESIYNNHFNIDNILNNSDLKHVWNELKHIITLNTTSNNNSSSYEILYTISHLYNTFDKISFVLIDYVIEKNSAHECKDWSFKYLIENNHLENYNEPDFRMVTRFMRIANVYSCESYSEELTKINSLRNIITHRPINSQTIHQNYCVEDLKDTLESYNITFLLLADIAIEINRKLKNK